MELIALQTYRTLHLSPSVCVAAYTSKQELLPRINNAALPSRTLPQGTSASEQNKSPCNTFVFIVPFPKLQGTFSSLLHSYESC